MSAGLENIFAVEELTKMSSWSLLWYCRAQLWDIAQRQGDRSQFWIDHYPVYSYFYVSLTKREPFYVNFAFELDRLINGRTDALAVLQQQLVHISKSCQRDLRVVLQAFAHLTEACLQPEACESEKQDAERRFWLYRARSRLQSYLTHRWWGKYDIERCRAQIMRYDLAAKSCFKWWHALVGWWQGIGHKRKIVALSDVCSNLQTVNTTLSDSLKTLATVDKASCMLASSIQLFQCSYAPKQAMGDFMRHIDRQCLTKILALNRQGIRGDQLLQQLPEQVRLFSDMYYRVQQAQSRLTLISEDLSQVARDYHTALICFDDLKNLYKSFSVMKAPEGCDADVWDLFHKKVPSVLTQVQSKLQQQIIKYEQSLVKDIQQYVHCRPSISACLSRLLSLFKKDDKRLYDRDFRQQQVEQFTLPESIQKIFSLGHISPVLEDLYGSIEPMLQNELKQLMSFWQLVAEIKSWREDVKDWKQIHTANLKYLKRFKFKSANPEQLQQAWAVFQKLQASFYAIDMPIDLSCRCEVIRRPKEYGHNQPLPTTVSKEFTPYIDPCNGGSYGGYYKSTVFDTNDYRYLKPNRGLLIYQESQDRWYIQAQDKTGQRRLSDAPQEEGFSQKDMAKGLELMKYLALNESVVLSHWHWEDGLALSQQLAQWLGQPVYRWKYQLADMQFTDIDLQPFFKSVFTKHLGLTAPIACFYRQFHEARSSSWKHFCDGLLRLNVSDVQRGREQLLPQLKFAIRRSPDDWKLLVSTLDTLLPQIAPDYIPSPRAILAAEDYQKCQEVIAEEEIVRVELWGYPFKEAVGAVGVRLLRLKTLLVERIIQTRHTDVDEWLLQIQSDANLKAQFNLVTSAYRSLQAAYHKDRLVYELKRIAISSEKYVECVMEILDEFMPKLQSDYDQIRTLLTDVERLASYVFIEILPTITRGAVECQYLQDLILDWYQLWRANQDYCIEHTLTIGAESLGHRRDAEEAKCHAEEAKRDLEKARSWRRLVQRKHRLNGALSEFGKFSHDFRAPLSSLYEAVGKYIGCELTPCDDMAFTSYRAELESLISLLKRPIALISVGRDGNVEDETYLYNDWIKQHPLWGQAEGIPVFYDYEQNLYGFIDCQEQDRAQAVFKVVDQLLVAEPQKITSISTAQPCLFAQAQISATETSLVDSHGIVLN